MATFDKVKDNSESLIELLGAQCTDLEQLLALAREETVAAQEGKFLKIWDIVSERAAIGKRLETYHRQISELRGNLEAAGENVNQFDITNRVIELANSTLVQDQKTRSLLTASRDQATEGLKALSKGHIGSNAYLKENTKGLAYSRNF
jgi:flagellar biosynthesis/type III secretory pathway chaperone